MKAVLAKTFGPPEQLRLEDVPPPHAAAGEVVIRVKASGVNFGRPAALSPHQRQEAMQRLAQGEVQADVARTFSVSQATISRLSAASGVL